MAESDPNGVSAATSDPDVTATNNTRVSSLFPNVPVLPGNLLQQAISSLESSSPETLKSNVDTGKSEPAKVLSTNAEERTDASQPRSPSLEGTPSLYLVIPQQLDQAHTAIPGGDYQGSGGRVSVVHSSKYDSSLYRSQLPALPDSSAITASAQGGAQNGDNNKGYRLARQQGGRRFQFHGSTVSFDGSNVCFRLIQRRKTMQ